MTAANGTFEIFPRIQFDRVRRFFDLYADIEIDFHFLEGDNADYNGMAKGYQAWQFAHGVKPIKERIRDYPDLAYMCDAMVIRIQTHGAKTIPDKPTDFTKETEWPINVYMPFDKAEEFVSAIRASGIDKAAIVSAGWNKGGYDGQLPEHFHCLAHLLDVLGGQGRLSDGEVRVLVDVVLVVDDLDRRVVAQLVRAHHLDVELDGAARDALVAALVLVEGLRALLDEVFQGPPPVVVLEAAVDGLIADQGIL